ncbi:MAG TPA: cytochrome P450 [Dehalococcoidia bacterium]|nr:cytochrome P450 [Dehalococcoidia bacterium]
MVVQYNPFDLRFRTNPYPLYEEMRREDPIQWSAFLQVWVFTRYRDNVLLLSDPRFSADRRRAQNPFAQAMIARQEEFGPLGRAPTMLSVDPPEHTRLRRIVSKAFTPRRVEDMRPYIWEVAQDLLAQALRRDGIEIIRDLAYPLPVIVIAEMLGVPRDERETFKRWSDDVTATLGAPFVPAETLEQARQTVLEMTEYFRAIIQQRRRDPKNDLISALLHAEEQEQALSEDEVLSTCILLLIAGNETTTNLIGNGVLALLQHPGDWQRLRETPDLIADAVEEMLRYDSPVQATSRVAREEMEIEGKVIKEGQVVIAVLAAGNRDPEAFPDPDRFDITRRNNRHLSFGDGSHFCLGAALARTEAQIAVSALLESLREPQLASEQLEWSNSFILRGLKSLPVSIG